MRRGFALLGLLLLVACGSTPPITPVPSEQALASPSIPAQVTVIRRTALPPSATARTPIATPSEIGTPRATPAITDFWIGGQLGPDGHLERVTNTGYRSQLLYIVYAASNVERGQRIFVTISRDGKVMPQGGSTVDIVDTSQGVYHGIRPYTPSHAGRHRVEFYLDDQMPPFATFDFSVEDVYYRHSPCRSPAV